MHKQQKKKKKSNDNKKWLFTNSPKMNKPLAKLMKKIREKTQIANLWNERGSITGSTSGIVGEKCSTKYIFNSRKLPKMLT